MPEDDENRGYEKETDHTVNFCSASYLIANGGDQRTNKKYRKHQHQ